jgi:hypothetical protein
MELIICIVITNINNINIIKNTWLKLNENNKYYFIFDSFHKNKIDDEDNYIFIDINEVHFEIINYFHKNKYNFIYITYDNSFTNLINLNLLLKDINFTEPIYLGGHGDYRTINNIKFYFHSYTPGIILSKKATELLNDELLMLNFNNINNNEFKNLSGVAIGYYSHIMNFKLINNDNFHYCNWKGNPCCPNNICSDEIITCSNMNTNDMYEYYDSLICNLDVQNTVNNKMKLIIFPGGGLGNLIFQYINAFALKKRYDCELYFQKDYKYWRGTMNSFNIFNHLKYVNVKLIDKTTYINYDEKEFNYYDIQLNNNNNYKIHGYYQSYKYSELYIDEIKSILFNNITSKVLNIKNKYNSLLKNKPTCLIHVRRGDYLIFTNAHPICEDKYYINALKIMGDYHYLICSDDTQYINSWPVIKNIDHSIIDLTDPEELLIFMSLCDNFIIANSSLSLLGYLFRDNKFAKLIAPEKWFGSDGPKFKIEDIVPPEGILL